MSYGCVKDGCNLQHYRIERPFSCSERMMGNSLVIWVTSRDLGHLVLVSLDDDSTAWVHHYRIRSTLVVEVIFSDCINWSRHSI